MIRKWSIIVLTTFILISTLCVNNVREETQIVFINEVRSWDASDKHDEYLESDYIELYNASKVSVSLDGWYLSDDETNLKKCRLNHLFLEGEDFVILCADGKQDSEISLNFKLDPEGEKIFLSDSAGNLIDSVWVPKQEFGTVYARVTDGAKTWCVQEETTKFSNNGAKQILEKTLESPVVSHVSGFYEKPFLLTLQAKKGQKIFYTLDGSEPTEDSLLYKDGIFIENVSTEPNVENAVQNVVEDWLSYVPDDTPVDKAVVVRAVAKDSNGNSSETITATYFVELEKYLEGNVISLIADFDDMFGDEGIFVTGKDYDKRYLSGGEGEWVAPNFFWGGRKWEIQGNMQLFKSGTEIVNQEVGIRTQGGSNRRLPKKRMSIYARKEYGGNPYLKNLIMSEKDIHSVSFNKSIANVVLPALVKDRDVAVQEAIGNVVFLNGEYWYDCYTLEKYNKYYLEETYGVDRENVIIIKNQSHSEGPDNSYAIYGELLGFVSNTDLSDSQNYERLEQMMDIQSYIDYIAANVYLCNMDVSEIKNYLLWRTIENDGTDSGDNRWRWMMYDTDCLEWMNSQYYGVDEKAAVNSFDETMEHTESAINEHTIYSAAKRNPDFCRQFVTSFLDMANVNFSMENVNKVFSEWNSSPQIYGDFFENRFGYIVPYMAEEFELSGTLEEVKLEVNDVAGGHILLNTTTPDVSNGMWTGKYYTDYPITVTAVPKEGYRFVGWNGSVSADSDTIEVEILSGGISLKAVFEKISE